MSKSANRPNEKEDQWEFDYRPHAAARYNGDYECQYDGCEESSDWVVDWKSPGYDGGKITLCCQSCSRENRVYADENDLDAVPLREKVTETLPDEIVEDTEVDRSA